MQREKIPTRPETLSLWLSRERRAESVAAILDALRQHPRPRCVHR